LYAFFFFIYVFIFPLRRRELLSGLPILTQAEEEKEEGGEGFDGPGDGYDDGEHLPGTAPENTG